MADIRSFAKLASNLDENGNITLDGFTSDFTNSISAAGTASYDSVGELPRSGINDGDTAYVASTSRLYIASDNGWYGVAVINTTPSFQSITDDSDNTTPFNLSTQGAITTVTIIAQDSDGDPVTYDYSADSDFNGLANISQNNNVFTITPYSEDSATTTSGTITFTATDGTNIAYSNPQTFTLYFSPDWSLVSQGQVLTASDAAGGDAFGWHMAIDGDTMLIGAKDEDGSLADAGCGYIFVRNGTTWTEQAKIAASKGYYYYNGYRVALSGDTAVLRQFNSASGGPQINVWVRSGTSWSQEQIISASSNVTGLAIQGDYIFAGTNSGNGSVFVYKRTAGVWSLHTTLTASDGQSGEQFGWDIAVDGTTLAISAVKENDPAASAGAVYIFTTSDGGNSWTEQAKVKATDAANQDEFGYSVALSGTDLVVGAWLEGGPSYSGTLYTFTGSGSTWTQTQKIKADNAGTDDDFGVDVAIFGDAIIVGAPKEDTGGTDRGSAYIFTRTGGVWTQTQRIQATGLANSDNFGQTVAIDNKGAYIGAPYYNNGAVFVWEQ